MEIAWAEFTPVASFAGGAMIGLAALFLMLLNGRVMGMSGILSVCWSSDQIGLGGSPLLSVLSSGHCYLWV